MKRLVIFLIYVIVDCIAIVLTAFTTPIYLALRYKGEVAVKIKGAFLFVVEGIVILLLVNVLNTIYQVFINRFQWSLKVKVFGGSVIIYEVIMLFIYLNLAPIDKGYNYNMECIVTSLIIGGMSILFYRFMNIDM